MEHHIFLGANYYTNPLLIILYSAFVGTHKCVNELVSHSEKQTKNTNIEICKMGMDEFLHLLNLYNLKKWRLDKNNNLFLSCEEFED